MAPDVEINTTTSYADVLVPTPQRPVHAGYANPFSAPKLPSGGCRAGVVSLDACIIRSAESREGLLQQVKYLRTKNQQTQVATGWANVSNGALLQTAQELLSWEGNYSPYAFLERFYLREIYSKQRPGHAEYTGYFTPQIQVRRTPNAEYRFPIYAPPRWAERSLTRAQIDAGALRGRGLEIGWTNDPVNLYFAHIQGSAIARFEDGSESFMDFAASNNSHHASIGRYLRNQGYGGSLSNERMRDWLHQHPDRIAEVLHHNPRYIFFKFTKSRPRTSTGMGVIPWHTVAVDDRFIPLGAVLLAEIPRIDHKGQIVGADWRLLFAQDRGKAIQGPGRLDFYTGAGALAEQATYHLTGFRKTYLLVRKPGFTGDSFAGL